jgi:sugar (pentulose or hexulose) kinase
MKRYYLAIDIGASSGRHIVGWQEYGELKTKEVYRFPNGVTEQDGHLTWDIERLFTHVKTGIEKAKAEFPQIVSLSIDTWGVDYVLMRGDSAIVIDRLWQSVKTGWESGIAFHITWDNMGRSFYGLPFGFVNKSV